MLDSMFEPRDPALENIDDILALFPPLADVLTTRNLIEPHRPKKQRKKKRKLSPVIEKSTETDPTELAQLCDSIDQEIAEIKIKLDQAFDRKERNKYSAHISRLQAKKKLFLKDQTISLLTMENKVKDDEILNLRAQVQAYEFLLTTMREDMNKLQDEVSSNIAQAVVFQYSLKQSQTHFDIPPNPRSHAFIEPSKLG